MHVKTTATFELKDVDGSGNSVKGEVVVSPRHILVKLDGYGEKTAAVGCGQPVLIELTEKGVRVIVWGDINSEEPTSCVSLEGAREEKRKDWPSTPTSKPSGRCKEFDAIKDAERHWRQARKARAKKATYACQTCDREISERQFSVGKGLCFPCVATPRSKPVP
jgi:hypothetical protein